MNNTNPKQLILRGVLVLGAIGAVLYQVMGSGSAETASSGAKGKNAKKANEDPVQRFVEVDVNIDTLLEGIRAVNFDYASERISRDPMTPLVGQLAENANQQGGGTMEAGAPGSNRMEISLKKITGIVWDKYDPRAVIDNEVVGIGYTYPSGVQIYNIDEKRVTFKDGDSLIHRDLEDGGR